MKQLSPKQAAVMAALLFAPSIAEAAKRCHMSQRSIFRYLKDPLFVACYQDARRELVEHAICQLERMTEKAVQVLEQVMDDPLSKSAAKVMACRTVLHLVVGSVEDEDLPRVPPPTPAPKYDLSKLSAEEWGQFKALREKTRVT